MNRISYIVLIALLSVQLSIVPVAPYNPPVPVYAQLCEEQQRANDIGAGYVNVCLADCPAAFQRFDVASTTVPTHSIAEFIEAYGQLAFDVGQEYGIPYDAMIAHAINESAYARSGLTQEANAFFGIKGGASWPYGLWVGQTQEDYGDGLVTITDGFRKYPNVQTSFRDYGSLVNRLYTDAAEHPTDPKEFIRNLVDDPPPKYATDRSFVSKIHNLIDRVQEHITENNLWPISNDLDTPIGGSLGPEVAADQNSVFEGTPAANVNGSHACSGEGGNNSILGEYSDDARVLAQQILDKVDEPNSPLSFGSPSTSVTPATVRGYFQQIADTGIGPITASNGGGSGAAINPKILRVILILADEGIQTKITAITNAAHSTGSQHYKGEAVDLSSTSDTAGIVNFVYDNREELDIYDLFHDPLPEKNINDGTPCSCAIGGHAHVHISIQP